MPERGSSLFPAILDVKINLEIMMEQANSNVFISLCFIKAVISSREHPI